MQVYWPDPPLPEHTVQVNIRQSLNTYQIESLHALYCLNFVLVLLDMVHCVVNSLNDRFIYAGEKTNRSYQPSLSTQEA